MQCHACASFGTCECPDPRMFLSLASSLRDLVKDSVRASVAAVKKKEALFAKHHGIYTF
jgi:hypothetical protein